MRRPLLPLIVLALLATAVPARAAPGDPDAFSFPVAKLDGLDFSFSGVKTALLYAVRNLGSEAEARRADLAASYQRAIVRALVERTRAAAEKRGHDQIAVVGGVAANSRLRAMATERAAAVGIRVRVPRPGLCTDNGAMVAALGTELVARGRAPSALDLPADSSQPITTVVV